MSIHYHFSIRSLLGLVLVASVICGVLWAPDPEWHARSHLVALGANLAFEYDATPMPWRPWLTYDRVAKVDFYRCKMDADTLQVLQDLPAVKQLNIRQCADLSADSLQYLRSSSNLKRLHLDGNAIDDDWLPEIVQLRQIRELNLRNTRITDSGIKYLPNIKELTRLNLEGTAITSDAMPYIGRLAKLEYLNLKDTHISASGLLSLHDLKNLESLDLRGTGLEKADVEPLAQVLPTILIWH